MAIVLGDLRTDKATWGEKKVLDLLKGLPDDYIVWPELRFDRHSIDFVVLNPRLGLLVLEVKDWGEITQGDADRVMVLATNNESHYETNPEKAARNKATDVMDRLSKDRRLLHKYGIYQGKPRLPWAHGVIFPNVNIEAAGFLRQIINDLYAIYRDSLRTPQDFEKRLRSLDWRFECNLSQDDVSIIRGILRPEMQIPIRNSEGKTIQGVVDVFQEQAVLEGLYDDPALFEEDLLTEGGRRAATNMKVRMVRGPAGTGKTLVVAARAKNLVKDNPTWRIMVVCYNRGAANDLKNRLQELKRNVEVGTFHHFCMAILKSARVAGNGVVDDSNDRIAAAMLSVDGAERFTSEFVIREIQWIKDLGVTDRERYLTADRTGRALALRQEDRGIIYDIYQAYQRNLDALRLFDWEDVARMVLAAFDQGLVNEQRHQYDAILVDEAQDFAPIWFELLRRMLRPKAGSIFIAADGNQRIYRNHSWKSMGLDVVGRSRVLRVSYRNTYEITQIANELVRRKPHIQQSEEYSRELAEVDRRWTRHGDWPAVISFTATREKEAYRWLRKEIAHLLDNNYSPDQIGIITKNRATVTALETFLTKENIPVGSVKSKHRLPGITVETIRSAKGLEFRAVFVMRIDHLLDPDNTRPAPTDAERSMIELEDFNLLYVAITRPSERLYLQYYLPLPPQLESYINFVKSAGQTGQRASS